MRGHIGFKIPRVIYTTYLTLVEVDAVTYAESTPEIRLSYADIDVVTYSPTAQEVHVSYMEIDVVTYGA